MQDRISTYQGRVTLTPVSGQVNTYDMVRADSPEQTGTPLNTENLLSQRASATILTLAGVEPENPSEAFIQLSKVLYPLKKEAVGIASGSYTGTGTSTTGVSFSETFEFTPMVIMVIDSTAAAGSTTPPSGNYMFIAVQGASQLAKVYSISSETPVDVTWDDYTITLANGTGLNVSGHIYKWVVIGQIPDTGVIDEDEIDWEAAVLALIDDTLTLSDHAADAKAVGDEINTLKSRINNLNPGISATAKALLIEILTAGVYTSDQSDNIAALEQALESSGGATVYQVRYNLTDTISSNAATVVEDGDEYVTVLSANGTGYSISSVSVTMGGTDITAEAWNSATSTVTISSVTGAVVITAVSAFSTQPEIDTENVGWTTTGTQRALSGAGVTIKYPYAFDEDVLTNCQYYDATNDYMSSNGWCGIKYFISDVNFLANGYSWTSTTTYTKHTMFRDGAFADYASMTRNAETNWQFQRYKTDAMRANSVSFTLPLDDLDDCYAYWYKPSAGSILPDGVDAGDIIFAGKNTNYYGMKNISEYTG